MRIAGKRGGTRQRVLQTSHRPALAEWRFGEFRRGTHAGVPK